MSRPPYSSTVAAGHLDDGLLVGHVDVDGDAPAEAVRGDDLVGHLLGAVDVEVGDDDVGAALGEQARGGAADPARAAGDQRDPAGELAARRRLRELVALERPVLDRERLALAQRAEAAERVGRVLDRDRPVVEVAREARARRVGARRDDADARDEHDARPGRVDRERPRLVVEVALVVVAVPVGVLGDPAPERRGELRRAVRLAGRSRRRAACAWC